MNTPTRRYNGIVNGIWLMQKESRKLLKRKQQIANSKMKAASLTFSVITISVNA